MKAIVIVGVVLTAAQAGLGAQDSLSAAKDLYASAAYEDALSTLTRLNGDVGTAPEIVKQVDEYRAFCLYALGRTGEAESVAESIIRKEPLTKLDAADASPRLELMFTNVRKRLLPSLIRERFRTARSALDQKDYSAAEPQLTEARLMISDAEKLGVKDDGLADLSILVDGFLQLIRSTADQRTSPAPAPASSPASAPAPAPAPAPKSASAPAAAAAGSNALTPPARPQVPQTLPPAAPGSARVYNVGDDGVSPPVALDQRLPAMTIELARIVKALKTTMLLDVVIDEKGDVVNSIVRRSMNASFDDLIVRASRRWKYRPAMKDGGPVRYVKTLVLVP
jgi:TonB family protein